MAENGNQGKTATGNAAATGNATGDGAAKTTAASSAKTTALVNNQLHERGGEAMKAERAKRMLEIEDEILQTCAGIIQAHLAYHEVQRPDPANPERHHPPEAWVEKYGLKAAEERLAVAESGWLHASREPSGSVAARQIYVGIAKSRGQKGAIRAPDLNVTIALPAPTSAAHPVEGQHVYPSKVLDE